MLNPISLLGEKEIFDEDRTKLYKEKAIIRSIEKANSHNVVYGYMLVGDAFDMPGKYTFPKIIKYINDNTNKKILNTVIGINNIESVKKQFDMFVERI